MRSKSDNFNWNACIHFDINVYALNVTSIINNLASECIINRLVTVRPNEPSWINSKIKSLIRKRKRLYRRAKETNNNNHWQEFRQLQNEIINMIRTAKHNNMQRLRTDFRTKNVILIMVDCYKKFYLI